MPLPPQVRESRTGDPGSDMIFSRMPPPPISSARRPPKGLRTLAGGLEPLALVALLLGNDHIV